MCLYAWIVKKNQVHTFALKSCLTLSPRHNKDLNINISLGIVMFDAISRVYFKNGCERMLQLSFVIFLVNCSALKK